MVFVSIQLPLPMKEWIDQQVEHEGFSNTGEYLRTLVRKDRVCQEQITHAGADDVDCREFDFEGFLAQISGELDD